MTSRRILEDAAGRCAGWSVCIRLLCREVEMLCALSMEIQSRAREQMSARTSGTTISGSRCRSSRPSWVRARTDDSETADYRKKIAEALKLPEPVREKLLRRNSTACPSSPSAPQRPP